ncbi:hypothetical protein [Mesorhizobium sp. L-2-11]|uniref:hypothetical protein n=1 Tax=Mesorhizobium sp. L-2-11 TaxID=2744521 RepID=UPI001925B55F|nr:hypothetical protein [Mesorhizobium sp. L-2-11]BCH18863.1 hypothetical protein MesoLjLa_57140 [Mesorhizobium sp. L-2-11]
MKGIFKTALATLDRTVRAARSDLDALRDRITDLQSKRHNVEFTPNDRATMEREIDKEIAAALDRRPLHFPALVRGEFMLYRGSLSADLKHALVEDPFGVLAAFDAGRLKAGILATLPSDGISPEARSAQLAKIDADILSTEIAEEVACRELERGLGASVSRREDANPAILLAPDKELGMEPADA